MEGAVENTADDADVGVKYIFMTSDLVIIFI